MKTLTVVEDLNSWHVEHEGRVIFKAMEEERCFQHALAASSKLFEEGVQTEVVLRRYNWAVN
jgi:hypothetical protein